MGDRFSIWLRVNDCVGVQNITKTVNIKIVYRRGIDTAGEVHLLAIVTAWSPQSWSCPEGALSVSPESFDGSLRIAQKIQTMLEDQIQGQPP